MTLRDTERSCGGSLFVCLACSLPLPSSRAVPVSQECSQGRQGPLRSGVGVGGDRGGGGRVEDGACVCVCACDG